MGSYLPGNVGAGVHWRLIGWSTAGLILLLPLAAMQVSEEVVWTLGDFAAAALLLGTVGGVLGLAMRYSRVRSYRAAAGIALTTTMLIVWINLAVGLIGNEDNSANLLFFGVLLVAAIGSILARFRAAGMAVVMATAALVQALVPATAWLLGLSSTSSPWTIEVFFATAFLSAMWLISAWLFRVTRSRG